MMRKKVDKFYTLVIGKIVMAVGAVMVLAIAVQIATRYIPGFSITWTDELARLMFVWYGFLGAALAVPKGVHLGIDFFYRKSRGWLRKCFDGVVVTCMLIFSGTVLYSGATLLKVVSRQNSSVLGVPLTYFYGTVPVCALLILIYTIAMLIDELRGEDLYEKEEGQQ